MIDFRTALVKDPLVSVVVPTYRHARFIAKCLDSILMQQCDFEWELIIGEDGSDDGTKEICTRYAEEHPDRIRLMHRDRRDVIHILGRATGRSNVIKLYEEARGKYIAICEGDDLWIEPMKLQRQVDALEARPDAMGCFTNVYNDREGDRVPYFAPGTVSEPPAEVDQLAVLLGQAIPTCSFIFRRAELPSIPPEFYKAPVADTLLFAHVSRHGPLLYLPVLAGVRHVHPGGINSMKSRAHKMKVM
jgi:glycosyltransferase involved in cell wall biosynthesis